MQAQIDLSSIKGFGGSNGNEGIDCWGLWILSCLLVLVFAFALDEAGEFDPVGRRNKGKILARGDRDDFWYVKWLLVDRTTAALNGPVLPVSVLVLLAKPIWRLKISSWLTKNKSLK